MTEEIILAGFGGQGVLLSGKLLCIAGMREGLNVSHIPSYGAEMRGGTANCRVIVSDEEIASPVIEKPSVVIALNMPSLHKFEPKLKEGGLLIYNSSLIPEKPQRGDIEVHAIEANRITEERGTDRGVSLGPIGLLIKLRPALCSLGALKAALDEAVTERNRKHNPVNESIIEAGFNAPL